MTNPTQPAEGMPEPTAWRCTRRTPDDGTKLDCVTNNPEYVKIHAGYDWAGLYTADQMREYGSQCAEAASAKCPRHGVYMCVACRKGEAAPKAPPMPEPTDQQLIRLYFRARYPDEGDEAADRFATQGAHWAVNRALEWSRGFLAWLAAQGFTKE